jgi:hypothetical protein
MVAARKSPKIKHIEWGKVEVEGVRSPYKDVKLYPGGSRAWDWNETGTRHDPGIQPADVQELLENGAQVIVLSKGHHEQLKTKPDTLEMLRQKNVAVHILETSAVVALYNQLAERQAVGALIHSTC